MSQPTPAEIALLRNQEHQTHLYLSIYQPKTVLSCQVNNVAIAKSAIAIVYDGASGSYLNVHAGMTLYVGSSAGGSDYGRIRVRSITATTITVATNDISWKDDLYLTIKEFYEVWPIFQKLQSVGSTPDTADVIVYKDEDITYTDQNDHPGSLIWMGGHQAAMAGDQIYWSATGTVNTEGVGITYAWEFEGGSPSSGTVVTPGLVTYSTPGHYTTKLMVTSANGTVDTSYRHVSIYNDANPPIQKWGLNDLQGSRSDGSYTAAIWIKEPIGTIVDGALVVIFSDTWYGSTRTSINGKIVFVGYILDGSIVYDWRTSTVEFDVGSVTEIMKLCSGPGVSLVSFAPPTGWEEMEDVTIRKAIWWFLRWHTTVLNLADVCYLGTNYSIGAFETEAGTLYDVLNGFMDSTLFGSAIANRPGQIVCEINPEAIDNAPSAINLGMSLDRQDWMNTPTIHEKIHPAVAYLEAGGFSCVFTGISGVNTPYMAAAPGDNGGYYGESDEHEGLALSSQAHLNTLIGNVYAYRNSRYPEVPIDLKGNYNNIDLTPNERYLLTIDAEDSQNRLAKTLNLHPTAMVWKYVPQQGVFLPSVTFHELTTGTAGDTIVVPDEVEDIIPYTPPNLPPINIPPPGIIPPIPPYIPPVIPPEYIPPTVVTGDHVGVVIYFPNLNLLSYSWTPATPTTLTGGAKYFENPAGWGGDTNFVVPQNGIYYLTIEGRLHGHFNSGLDNVGGAVYVFANIHFTGGIDISNTYFYGTFIIPVKFGGVGAEFYSIFHASNIYELHDAYTSGGSQHNFVIGISAEINTDENEVDIYEALLDLYVTIHRIGDIPS